MISWINGLLRGKPRPNLWERFDRVGEGIAGTMSRFYKVRDRKTGDVFGLKLPDQAKVAPIESRYRGLHKPSEGEIGSLIRGQHVVRTIDWGTASDVSPYILMDFIEGAPVHVLLARHEPLQASEKVAIVRQMAVAVGVVHESGFVHRDICPRNLLLRASDRQVFLFDFGLTVPDRPAFLQPGNRTGTPNYMAPEVIRRRPVDRRLDIFSLGVSAFEVCSGSLPWPGGNARAALNHDTEPTNLRTLWSDAPEPLAAVIMDCLRPDPDQRPESTKVFLQRIARVGSD